MSIAEQITELKQDFDDVYEAGKKSQYDEFWDVYQTNGRRTDYKYAFAGIGWTAANFYPKYDIMIDNGVSTFQQCNAKISLKERLEECGVELRWISSSMSNTFVAANFTELP